MAILDISLPAVGGFSVYLILAFAPIILYYITAGPQLYSGIPAVGIDENAIFGKVEKARQRWIANGIALLDEGLKKFSGCFQVVTSTGPKIVLPNRFAEEIRNHSDMSFGQAISKEFFGNYPGFEPFDADAVQEVVVETVRGKLTQSLNLITEDLRDETSKALDDLFGRSKGKPSTRLSTCKCTNRMAQQTEWRRVQYKPLLMQLVARASSRVFIGEDLCANQDFLDMTTMYAIQCFTAADELRAWPFFLRPIVHWVLPECRKLRADLVKVRSIIEPIAEKSRKQNREASAAGEKLSKKADTIGWMDDVAAKKGIRFDVTIAQLGLSFAAVHTTSELVSGIISDLCANTQWIEPMRQEMTEVIKAHGWTKKALHEMKFTDSLMKESQRHHFGDIAAMHRLTTNAVTLSDGTTLPKNAFIMVGLDMMKDESIFENPLEYNPRRFFDMRNKPGQENKWHFVSTSVEHLAFGHGQHSCPGRFFAANEIKLILIFLFLKYDWNVAEGGQKKDTFHGSDVATDPTATALIRFRNQDLIV